MNLTLKRPLQVALGATAVLVCALSTMTSYVNMVALFVFLYTLVLLSHLVVDYKKNSLFISVIGLFLLSCILNLTAFEMGESRTFWLYASYFPQLVAYFILLWHMIKTNKHQFQLKSYGGLAILILGIDIWLTYELISLLLSYDLSGTHIIFFFLLTILNMILLSIGMLFYITNNRKHRKIALLNLTLTCFFIRDLADTTSSLYFRFERVPAISILENVLVCCGLLSFYVYCTTSGSYDALEESKI